MYIQSTDLRIQREPFNQPFGFKGSSFHEKWNAVVRLEGAPGEPIYGVGGLAVLWSDQEVFAAHTEVGGNLLMLTLLEHALQVVKGRTFADPIEMQRSIFDTVHAYGKVVTGRADLRPTFTLNALVALDNAAWALYALEQGSPRFDDLIPAEYRVALAERQERLAAVPLITYGQTSDQIRAVLGRGAALIKVKIGQSGSEEEMLAKDVERIDHVHRIASAYRTELTHSGRVLYYLDANGRYRRKESLYRLLDRADSVGMLSDIAILEEPFCEELEIDVSDLPVRVAADESLHSVADVRSRAQQGYGAVAIKPAGKTLSLALEMAQAATSLQLPCYVADNACVPVLVDWNKVFAARLPSFPGMRCGLMESNGPQMYDAWEKLLESMTCADASWLRTRGGAFLLDGSFYDRDGGIFLKPEPYWRLFDDNSRERG